MAARRVPVVLLVAGLGLLAACGGDDGSTPGTLPATTLPATTAPATTAAPAPPTTEAPATTSTTAAPTTTTEAPTTTTEPPAPGACLVGDWVITEEQMNVFYDQIEATSGGELSIQISGSTGLTFTTDGRFEYTPDFTLELEVIGAGGSGVTGGLIGGTYQARDGIVVTSIDRNEIEVTVDVMGQVFDGSDIAGGFLTSFPVADAPFDCSGPSPVIDFATGEGTPRVPVELTPA